MSSGGIEGGSAQCTFFVVQPAEAREGKSEKSASRDGGHTEERGRETGAQILDA